jgi:GNAT superfamily N-acetyltransferase
MITDTISLTALGPQHLDGALRLSRAAGWPHRPEDWKMSLALSRGTAAVTEDGTLVGTALVTPFRTEAATINMVIVDEAMRGRGLGRRLMEAAFDLAGTRTLRLIATREGLPLYEKLGFRETGTIVQHQGPVGAVAKPTGVRAALPTDIPAIIALDRAANGADREGLMAYIANVGRFAVIARDGRVTGFAACRAFGRGVVIGPVVAETQAEARDLLAFFLCEQPGQFMRVDTGGDTGLGPWLATHGLQQVGGGISMERPIVPRPPSPARTFALASQAFG